MFTFVATIFMFVTTTFHWLLSYNNYCHDAITFYQLFSSKYVKKNETKKSLVKVIVVAFNLTTLLL